MTKQWTSRIVEEKAGHVFLAAFRGFALVVATFQIFFVGDFRIYATSNWIILGVVAAFTLYKISRPYRWYSRAVFTYADIGFDLALATSLPLLTGGLLSPFLLYSICPILTSALFFPRRLTFSILGFPITALVVNQLLLYFASPVRTLYPVELSLALLGAIMVGSFLIAWLPYLMNINASQAIRAQAIINERSRLSREMHDGVAQSLGIVRWKMELLQEAITTRKMPEALEHATDVQGLVEEAQREVREAVDELRTTAAGQQGFVPALAQYASQFTQTYGIRCELHVTDGQVNLPLTAELELLRITREALLAKQKYKNVVVDVMELPLAKIEEAIVPVGSLEELVRVADGLLKPVLHLAGINQHTYCVIDGTTRYEYLSRS